jgi:hypothetical protein
MTAEYSFSNYRASMGFRGTLRPKTKLSFICDVGLFIWHERTAPVGAFVLGFSRNLPPWKFFSGQSGVRSAAAPKAAQDLTLAGIGL